MAKKKAASPVKRESNPFDLAAAVADRVQIRDVRVMESHLRQAAPIGRGQREIRVSDDVEVDFLIQSDPNSLLVLIHFTLRGWAGRGEREGDPALSIECTFGLLYTLSSLEGLNDAQYRAFAQINGVFNAWPYWREFVQNSAARMGLPQLVVPVFRFSDHS